MHNKEQDEQFLKQLQSKTKEELVQLLYEATYHMICLQDIIEELYERQHVNKFYMTVGDSRYEEAEEFLNQFAERY